MKISSRKLWRVVSFGGWVVFESWSLVVYGERMDWCEDGQMVLLPRDPEH
jgi:hypothetical protein